MAKIDPFESAYWRARGDYPQLEKYAKVYGLPYAFVLGVAYRETGVHNELGDGGHGHGVLQLDDRFHKIPPLWQSDPTEIIEICISLLAGDVAWAGQKWPGYDKYKIGAAAYNAGMGGALHGVLHGDADAYTTGEDYGAKVLEYWGEFHAILTNESASPPVGAAA